MDTDGARRAADIEVAVHEATKEGTLNGSAVYLSGVGSATRDLQAFVNQDFLRLAIVALTLIFLIVALMLRSPVAGVIVVATVIASYASALGASAVIWRYVAGQELHFVVPSLSFIALVAVGADYNLLLAVRIKEEAHAGLNTGIIRAFGGTGGVVTTAGIVFGLTMLAMLTGNVLSIAQVGSTIGIGLLVDTLIVRTIIVPSIAALTGNGSGGPMAGRQTVGRQSKTWADQVNPSLADQVAAPGRYPGGGESRGARLHGRRVRRSGPVVA